MRVIAIAIIVVAIAFGAWAAGSNAIASFKNSIAAHAERAV